MQAAHDAINSIPEIVRGAELVADDLPASAADVDGGKRRLIRDLLELRRAAMNKLGAHLDWDRRSAITMCKDPPADPAASFEDGDIETLLVERTGGGEPGSSGTDDGDVYVAHSENGAGV
jgi:hypothetical protein